MLTNLLTGVLASLVRTYSPSNPSARVLLATPTNERHAFPTLAAAMLIAAGGLGAIILVRFTGSGHCSCRTKK